MSTPDWTLEELRRRQPVALALSGREARALLALLDPYRDSVDPETDGPGERSESEVLSDLRDRVSGLLADIEHHERSL
ncbi:MAG: hypothetical protein ACFCVF_06165 [Kineosporiaceae bacterium]